jgi:hypothetical protein
LFQEAVQTLIQGDVGTAKSVLRDYFRLSIRPRRRVARRAK